jgi:hypothetical protein
MMDAIHRNVRNYDGNHPWNYLRPDYRVCNVCKLEQEHEHPTANPQAGSWVNINAPIDDDDSCIERMKRNNVYE